MAAMIDDFVLETASAFGTATTVPLAGAPTGRSSFSVFSDGQVIYFFIDDGTQWEACQGAFHTGSPNNVSRTTVIRNSAGTTSKLNFAGSARVYCEVPSSRRIYADSSGVVQSPSLGGTVLINGAAISAADSGRNKLHNPVFNVAQRGTGAFTTNGAYTLDRWAISLSGDTMSVTQQGQTDTGRSQIGDEESYNFLQNVFTGNASAGSYDQLFQRIELVRRLANKTVTVSFYAKAASGTPKLGVSLDQVMGTGGSPSANVNGTGQAVTLSTTWTRYNLTFTTGSLSGKTLGNNGDDCTQLNFWFSSGSTNATRAGSVGVQSGTVSLWGVQLEIGPVATALEKPDPQQDLANCQRFYVAEPAQAATLYGYNTTAASVAATITLPVQMRITPPVVNFSFGTSVNITTPSIVALSSKALQIVGAVTATGSFGLAGTWNASADL